MSAEVGVVMSGGADWAVPRAGVRPLDPLPADVDVTSLPGLSATRDEEFLSCFQAHFGTLTGYCAGLVGDRHQAQEIAQEAFTRLFAKWLSVREPRAYVFFVATNLAREQWRRRETERRAYGTVALRDAGRETEHDPWLRDLVERLPERLREAVLLHYYADLPVAEVARLVRRPVGTVKRRLFEARALLLAAMEESR